MCKVKNTYDPKNSKYWDVGKSTAIKQTDISHHTVMSQGCKAGEDCMNGVKIDPVTFKGKIVKDQFTFRLSKYNREVSMKMNFH